MAAPTPVSSLVHSSTLVTAGVYVLIRYGIILEFYCLTKTIVRFGVATMILAGASALFETDIKKVVALSTLRQLGLMVRCVGINLSLVAFFHLLTHAYFKALLFITVGNLIHLSDSRQDSRKTRSNGLISLPTVGFRVIANLRLIGFPFLAGFYSKDLIIESPLNSCSQIIVVLIFFVATMLTSAYRTRFIVSVLRSSSKSLSVLWVEDASTVLPLINLGLMPLAVIGGSLLR